MANPADRVYTSLLVIRCQAGDGLAFEDLVAGHHRSLRGFLHKMLGDQHNTDDVLQEVWMDVFRDLKSLKDPAAFLPWLYRVARNRAFGLLRRRRTPMGSIDEVDPIVTAEEEPDFTAADAQAVHAALGQLGPEHREVLLLRFIEDMSYEEIAAVAGCNIGTVRSRIHNAKRQLRIIIQHKAGQS